MSRVRTPATLAGGERARSESPSRRAAPIEVRGPLSQGRPTQSATKPGWDFGHVPVYPVSRPGDAAECEADAMAHSALSDARPISHGAATRIQRSATSQSASTSPLATATTAPGLGAGRPLDPAAREYFEPRFGLDFGQVRVHDDRTAHEAAAGIGARAFTHGQNIAFAPNQYAPETESGRELIAHELAHTIQQRRASAPAGVFRQPIPGWNFKPSDFAQMRKEGRKLRVAVESGFFPLALQENLVRTLEFVLGPAVRPPATEGVNAKDLFHGHLVIKRGSRATARQAHAAAGEVRSFYKTLERARTRAIGKLDFGSTGYTLTDEKIAKYRKAMSPLLPSFGVLLEQAAKIPGAAVMYHTFEFVQPGDLTDKNQKLHHLDPRRHYVTPLDTNQPRQYTPPAPDTYEKEFIVVAGFSFLVDDTGTVYVRPFSTDTGYTSLDLSTITGTTFPEPFQHVY